ncbi:MAG: hypothetical protein A2633_05835 [Candidatus Sungbacteria bacterium RIFCSPHIGHO2_01_FULL_47_32]|uniref:Cohesin domain-containing protein n=1 Tax=Candidatus Sungbacteria bacterium RIFCSPHIGHO2_01_FULL_47_32 TaxID=1802264 RepID=A0A1G2K5B1_9BACT|nr:MAG: hypothetical protein A2633_05835 [Candidatus Sungbacteria bacterium RIFCSPHIGHO2_01_FULL_47_32]
MRNFAKQYIRIFILPAVLSAVFFLLATSAEAARLYMTPLKGSYQPGDTFGVDVRIDSEGECVNVVDAKISFPKGAVRPVDFSRGESILTLWIETPALAPVTDTISFSGGIPGGYCGRAGGDPGISNVLGRIIFSVPGFSVGVAPVGIAHIDFLETSKVLLNDGLGTEAKLQREGSAFTISTTPSTTTTNEWVDAVRSDTTPPEPFVVEVQQNPLAFGGKHFIVFSTTDKQTGLDHYEVSEVDRYGNTPNSERPALWKTVQSPYVLSDQEIKSVIRVKAVDKAGNERVVEYVPDGYGLMPKPKPASVNQGILLGVGAGVLLLGLIIFLVRRKKRTRETTPPPPENIAG